MQRGTEWVVITVLAFMGGVVANIVAPSRRGMWGFAGAAIVGVFCGCAAGLSAHAFGAHEGAQYLIASGAGVFGDRVLSGILQSRKEMNVNVSGGLNNIGDNVHNHISETQTNQINQGE